MVQKKYEMTAVSSSDGNSMDSKVTNTITVRNKVDCAAHAAHHASNGFRMKDSDQTCELLNLQWTQLGGSDKVFVDTELPPLNVGWGDWSSTWTSCSLPCDSWTQNKYRSCPNAQYRGVSNCPGSDTKTQACNTDICPRVNKIVWKTNTESYADMADYDDDAGIKIAIVSDYGEVCWTEALNNDQKNWVKGKTDTFDEGNAKAQMDQCWDFRVPDRKVYYMQVK